MAKGKGWHGDSAGHRRAARKRGRKAVSTGQGVGKYRAWRMIDKILSSDSAANKKQKRKWGQLVLTPDGYRRRLKDDISESKRKVAKILAIRKYGLANWDSPRYRGGASRGAISLRQAGYGAGKYSMGRRKRYGK